VVIELVENRLKRPIHIEEVDQHARLGIRLALDPELDPEGMPVKPKALVVLRHPREPVRGFDRELAEDFHGLASPYRAQGQHGRAGEGEGISPFAALQRRFSRSSGNEKLHLARTKKMKWPLKGLGCPPDKFIYYGRPHILVAVPA
jgi:hypothetical protein